ncbi:hypothetical protein Q7C36_000337 [Tachysurus vachellii]|uniref:Uncharacterized protein n=1 Tax=Tachysurus vachellii TaxID=175792 RepID=A0AA88NXF0_TACVA|nr:hypothetical protein Q7C36_000337 [Tachysurus vachellii]
MRAQGRAPEPLQRRREVREEEKQTRPSELPLGTRSQTAAGDANKSAEDAFAPVV